MVDLSLRARMVAADSAVRRADGRHKAAWEKALRR